MVKGKPLLDEKGQIIGLIGINFDIHERRTRETLFEAIIENTSDEIWTVDKQHRLTAFNTLFQKRLTDAFGIVVTAGLDLPALFDQLQLPDIASRYRKWYNTCMDGQEVIETERYRVDENAMYREIRFNPIRENGQVTGVSVFSRDITRQVKTTQEIVDLKNLLQNVMDSSLTAIMTFKAIRGNKVKLPTWSGSLSTIKPQRSSAKVRER